MAKDTVPGRPTLFEKPKQVTVVIEQDVYDQLVASARHQRLSVSELIRRAIDILLKKQPCEGA